MVKLLICFGPWVPAVSGSMTTVHSNNPRECIGRLETLVQYAGAGLSPKAIREMIAAAVHMIIQQSRLDDGSRRVTYITEIGGMQGEVVTLQNIFLPSSKKVLINLEKFKETFKRPVSFQSLLNSSKRKVSTFLEDYSKMKLPRHRPGLTTPTAKKTPPKPKKPPGK